MECKRREVRLRIFEDQRCAVLKSKTDHLLICTDDRFIAKELSRPELQTMETFAPSYFEYMSSAVSANVSQSFPMTCSLLTPEIAPYPSGQSFRVLQTDFQKEWEG